jgi:hypothetical protein
MEKEYNRYKVHNGAVRLEGVVFACAVETYAVEVSPLTYTEMYEHSVLGIDYATNCNDFLCV